MVITWQSYIKQLATANKATAHGYTDPATALPRNTFFRNNKFIEVEEATAINLDSPYVVCGPIVGRPSGKELGRKRVVKTTLFFMAHSDETNDVLEQAQEQTFQLMLEFLAKFEYDYRTEGMCGPFYHFDPTKAFWSQVGPLANNDYGWKLDLEFEMEGELIYDPSKWF